VRLMLRRRSPARGGTKLIPGSLGPFTRRPACRLPYMGLISPHMAHKSLMIEASRIALQPLVRLWLASGVMYQDALRLLKALYIEVATREYGLRGRPTNAARV